MSAKQGFIRSGQSLHFVAMIASPLGMSQLNVNQQRLVHSQFMNDEVPSRSIYLVLEEDPIVAQDLAELLSGHRPGSKVHVSRSRAETSDLLNTLEHVSAAILDGGVDASALRDLCTRIKDRSGRVIVLHDLETDDPLATGEDTIFVRRPFTSDMILGALRIDM